MMFDTEKVLDLVMILKQAYESKLLTRDLVLKEMHDFIATNHLSLDVSQLIEEYVLLFLDAQNIETIEAIDQRINLESKIQKFRNIADKMQNQIDKKLHSATKDLPHTRKRDQTIQSMESEGNRLQLIQKILRTLADRMEDRTINPILMSINSRKDVELFMNLGDFQDIIRIRVYDFILVKFIEYLKLNNQDFSYYQAILQTMQINQIDTLRFDADQTKHFALDFKTLSEEQQTRMQQYISFFERYETLSKAQLLDETRYNALRSEMQKFLIIPELSSDQIRLKELLKRTYNMNIEGFFPTPIPLIAQMLEYANINSSNLNILEPSAGRGDIADQIKIKYPQNHLQLVELSPTLCEILHLKGYQVECKDFLKYEGHFDRIIMNPPFEKMQDIDHVIHAFNLLNPNGRLVSIMSESPFFNSQKKAEAFREFLSLHNATNKKLEPQSFTGKDVVRQTSVNTRIVIIDKD
jgi:hypothetical protein